MSEEINDQIYGVHFVTDDNGVPVCVYSCGDNNNIMVSGHSDDGSTQLCLSRVKRTWPEVIRADGSTDICDELIEAVDKAPRIMMTFETRDALQNFANFINKTLDEWDE